MVTRLKQWVGWQILGTTVDGDMSERAKLKFLPGDEANQVAGEHILDVLRRGKFIVFITDSGAILCHNAMSGYWDEQHEPWTFDYVEGERESTDDDVRLQLLLGESPVDHTRHVLRYHDARMFGSVHFVTPDQLAEKLDRLGPEALLTRNSYGVEQVTEEHMRKILDSKKTVKEILTDQAKLAGVGNIYVAEACWGAGILPHRVASTLSQDEVCELWAATRATLHSAIARKLDYGDLHIYRRTKCPVCEGPVTTEKLKGRSSYWCAKCQT